MNQESIQVCEKIPILFPEDWRLNLFYAMKLIDVEENYSLASKVMKPFSNCNDCPEYIRNIYRSFEIESHSPLHSIQLYLSDYYATPSKLFKRAILIKIEKKLKTKSTLRPKRIKELLNKITQANPNLKMIIREIQSSLS
jgi:hypothetical protein